jgi:hypothetical protein
VVRAAHNPAAVTKKVFFDINIGPNKAGRVVIGLYGNDVPKVRRILSYLPGWKPARLPAQVLTRPEPNTLSYLVHCSCRRPRRTRFHLVHWSLSHSLHKRSRNVASGFEVT